MGQSFYVYNSGDLKRKDNTLQFTSYEGEKRDIPIERIDEIYVMSEMTFNTSFISYISQFGIPIHFLIITIFMWEAIIQRRSCWLVSSLSSRLNIIQMAISGL